MGRFPAVLKAIFKKALQLALRPAGLELRRFQPPEPPALRQRLDLDRVDGLFVRPDVLSA